MRIFSIKLLPILFFMLFSIGGCNENGSENINSAEANNLSAPVKNVNANLAKDNIEELGKIINLPVQPEEATWREENFDEPGGDQNSPSPKGKKLIAVLEFSAADAQKITEQTGQTKPPIASDVDAESWFPPELIAKSQESGDENLKGTSYAAAGFLREPYKNGKITRINDTDFFVLELTSF